MFDSKKTEDEITNLSALVGSIRTNAEKINGAEGSQSLIEGITNMCGIAESKLSLVGKEISEVKKDV